MLHNLDESARQIFWGNLLLIVCCAFYLTWWLLAFRPENPIRGFRTGWLLLPAFAAGLAAVIVAARGLGAAGTPGLFPRGALLWGGAIAYVLLLALTALWLRRPVTTELFLIVGWAVLALSEVSALGGSGALTRPAALAFAGIGAVCALVSLLCYVLYYRLPPAAGYLDGTLPLLLAALVMAGIDLALLRR